MSVNLHQIVEQSILTAFIMQDIQDRILSVYTVIEMEITCYEENTEISMTRNKIFDSSPASLLLVERSNLLETHVKLEDGDEEMPSIWGSFGPVITVILGLVFLSYILVNIVTILMVNILSIL